MPKQERARSTETIATAVDALDRIESELRHLSGLLLAFRLMGETRDAVEPLAVSAIARCAITTLDDINFAWRTAIDTLRAG